MNHEFPISHNTVPTIPTVRTRYPLVLRLDCRCETLLCLNEVASIEIELLLPMTTNGELLEQQYACVEEYANSQSRLLNASMKKISLGSEESQELSLAVEFHESCRRKLQSHWRRLIADSDFCTRHGDHLDLSQRVIQTVAKNPSWGCVGLPSHSDGVLESNTVALASLRASMMRIKDIESG
jgi:hypothetical protein